MDAFCSEFDPEFVVVKEAVAAAVGRRRMFNLIPRSGVFKVDIIPLSDEPFDRAEFARRMEIEVFGTRLAFASPEDVILAKLRWFRKGDEVSGRQMEDARDVAAAQGARLDREYLRRWAADLGLSDLLDRLLKDVDA